MCLNFTVTYVVVPFLPHHSVPRQGSAFLRSGIHPGTLPSGLLRCTCMQRVRLRRTALRATPRMNTSTQPPEGAGRSKSKARSRAAGELTLGLLSDEKRKAKGEHRSPVGAGLPAMAA